MVEDPSLKNRQNNQENEQSFGLGRNKKVMQKYSSADRLHSNNRKYFVKPVSNKIGIFRSKGLAQSPLVLIDDNNLYFKRDRSSAPNVDPEIVQKLDFQKGVVIDKNYKSIASSVISSPTHMKLKDSKFTIPGVGQEPNPLGSHKYMGKFRMKETRQSRANSSMKRAIKIGKTKKIPKDFF